MAGQFDRSLPLFGEDGLSTLHTSRVALFGVGGVGGHCAEALARSGIGHLDLIDPDTVEITNLTRQWVATHSTLGKNKAQAAKERILDIYPECLVRVFPVFYLPDRDTGLPPFSSYDFIIDAVDTMTAKIGLIRDAQAAGVPIVCSMGAGNKTDPSRFRVTDLYKTDTDPMARILRKKLRDLGLHSVPVAWSDEPAGPGITDERTGKQVPASAPFVPGAVGMILASYVVRSLIQGVGHA